MSTQDDLEARLRRGLRAAADELRDRDLPAVGLRGTEHGEPGDRGSIRRRAVALAVAAMVLVVGTVVTLPREQPVPMTVGTSPAPPTAPPTNAPPARPLAAANGRTPGRAVVVGTELRFYDDTGQQSGAMALAPFGAVDAVASDLAGGWVACGIIPAPPPGPNFHFSLVWYPAGRDPVRFDHAGVTCVANSLQVVDSAEGTTVVYPSMTEPSRLSAGRSGRPALNDSFRGLVLATGAVHPIFAPSATPPGPVDFGLATLATGRLGLYLSGTNRFRVIDVGTGRQVAEIVPELDAPTDLSLAPDGRSVAVLARPTRDDDFTTVLRIFDLSNGRETYRRVFGIADWGAQLSYDGVTAAVGNQYGGDTTVIDVATGAERVLVVHGLLV